MWISITTRYKGKTFLEFFRGFFSFPKISTLPRNIEMFPKEEKHIIKNKEMLKHATSPYVTISHEYDR